MKLISGFVLIGLVLTSVLLIAATAPVNKGGVWEPINELQAKMSDLQTQIDNIQLTPGPPGPPGETVHFGDWSEMNEYRPHQVYLAESDGFVCVYASLHGCEAGRAELEGRTSPYPNPARTIFIIDVDEKWEGFTMPVKAGWYWTIQYDCCCSGPGEPDGIVRIFWIPLIAPNTLPPHDV